MKLDFPKIVRELRLSEYAPEFGETCLQVWANPGRELRLQYDRAMEQIRTELPKITERDAQAAEAVLQASEQLIELMAVLWSQGPEETRWTAGEVRELIEGSQDTDPELFGWLRRRTIEIIKEHRDGAKKA